MSTIPHYEQNAEQLVSQYESLTFEEMHPALVDLLPAAGATILDVGAGSGRDASWFAAHGYDVVAVEPSDAMRTLARQRHPSPRIHWIADGLPDLAQVRRLGLSFDLILLSAVWMHVPPASRQRAMRKLATLLSPNGRIAISLRMGPPDTDRAMFEVTLPELTAIGQQFGLRLVHTHESTDKIGQAGNIVDDRYPWPSRRWTGRASLASSPGADGYEVIDLQDRPTAHPGAHCGQRCRNSAP